MADVPVRSLSVFYGSEERRDIMMGDEFTVTEDRARDLELNGLVERVEPVKPEPKPEPKLSAKKS
jgi:hypothetical protein